MTNHSPEFWSSVGHELRGPLATMLVHVETLEQGVFGELSAMQVSALKPILQEVKVMNALITDLVNVTSESAARTPLSLTPCKPYALCQQAFAKLAAQAQRCSVQWIDEALTCDLAVLADDGKVERVITELISVMSMMVPTRARVHFMASYLAPCLVLEVRHLPPEPCEDQLTVVECADLDLGVLGPAMKIRPLSCMILVQTVKALGGTWKLHRVGDQVTALSIALSVATPPEPIVTEVSPETTSELQPEPGLTTPNSMTVLIADDQPSLVSVTRHYLENLGYRVMEASDGRQAVDLAIQFQPDLIFMDVQMPAMNGLEAIRLIRAESNERLKTVPIVSLTGLASPSDKARCLAAGASSCLIKPFGIKDIDGILDRYIRPSI